MTVDISNQINDEKGEENIGWRTRERTFLQSLQMLKGKNTVDSFNYI